MIALKKLRTLVLLVCLLLAVVALVGVLWQGDGASKVVSAIDGREIVLMGGGTYANHSLVRATTYIGADFTMLVIVIPVLLISAAFMEKHRKSLFVCSGALIIVFYYSISLAFGAPFNNFFLIYTALFAAAAFTLGYSLCLVNKASLKFNNPSKRGYRGTASFLFMAGASALIWLTMIIPALVSGNYSEFIDVNTTEPTFVLDIGIVFPLFTITGIALLKKKKLGYCLTPILLTFYSLVGALVVMQAIVQHMYGIEVPLPQMIGLVISFIVLGAIALLLNINYMKNVGIVN